MQKASRAHVFRRAKCSIQMKGYNSDQGFLKLSIKLCSIGNIFFLSSSHCSGFRGSILVQWLTPGVWAINSEPVAHSWRLSQFHVVVTIGRL